VAYGLLVLESFAAIICFNPCAASRFHPRFSHKIAGFAESETLTIQSRLQNAMKKRIARIALVTLLLASSAAVAMSEQKNTFVSALDLPTFEHESQTVATGLGKGGRFEAANEQQEARVNELLGIIRGVISKTAEAGAISGDEKTLVAKSQDEINLILSRVDSERKICRMESPSGSNIPKRVCTTAAQRANSHDQAETIMNGGVGTK
jgi:hypothetical protein